MSFILSHLPDGVVNIRHRPCGVIARFLARDAAGISHWRRVHVCPSATTTPEPDREAAA